MGSGHDARHLHPRIIHADFRRSHLRGSHAHNRRSYLMTLMILIAFVSGVAVGAGITHTVMRQL